MEEGSLQPQHESSQPLLPNSASVSATSPEQCSLQVTRLQFLSFLKDLTAKLAFLKQAEVCV